MPTDPDALLFASNDNAGSVAPVAPDEADEEADEAPGDGAKRRRRQARPYPTVSLETAAELARKILEIAPTGRVRTLTLFEKLGRSPNSGTGRATVVESNKYGLTEGSYKSEFLEVTAAGRQAYDEAETDARQREARFQLGIRGVPPFARIYDEYVGKRVPAQEVMRDLIKEAFPDLGNPEVYCDLFQVNANYLGLMRVIGGAEHLISIDAAIEALPQGRRSPAGTKPTVRAPIPGGLLPSPVPARVTAAAAGAQGELDQVCFYITPIGADGSEQRKHSDLFLSQLIEPAMAEIGLTCVRADKIGESGMITSQVLHHIRHAALCIADLSFLNANVFYEVALRHACRKPIVQMIRKADPLPFDINQVRTVVIDNTDLYTFVPKMAVWRAEIITLARAALGDQVVATNPVSVFYPSFWNDSGA